jgi:hypothetical protein
VLKTDWPDRILADPDILAAPALAAKHLREEGCGLLHHSPA